MSPSSSRSCITLRTEAGDRTSATGATNAGADWLARGEIRVDDVAEDLARTAVERRQRARLGRTFCRSRHAIRMAGTGPRARRTRSWLLRLKEGRELPQMPRSIRKQRRGRGFAVGGQIFIDQLVAQGSAVYAFRVNLPRRPRRHEQRADRADRLPAGSRRRNDGTNRGRLTGRPGICFVTRGPRRNQRGAWLHIAEHDSAPMILFNRPSRAGDVGTGAFQEMDYRALFRLDHKARDADRIRGANPGNCPARLFTSRCKAGRSGRDRAARGHADGMAMVANAPRAEQVPIWPGLTQMQNCRRCCGPPSARCHPRRRRMDQAGERHVRPFRRTLELLSPARFAVQARSMRARNFAAKSVYPSIPS